MKTTHRLAIGAVCAGALAIGAAAHAQDIAIFTIDDSKPGEVTMIWQDVTYGAWVTQPTQSPMEDYPPDGEWTVAGESLSFYAYWNDGFLGSSGVGVIYLVDPGQPNLVRARIDLEWIETSYDNTIFDELVFTSSPIGGNLGTLPPQFAGLGIPMPDGLRELSYEFRDPATGLLTGNLYSYELYYIGDIAPECEEPVLFQALPDQADGYASDLDPYGGIHTESVESIMFEEDTVVESLRWWGMYYFSGSIQADADDFTLRVYEDFGGNPSASPVATIPLPNAVRAGTGNVVAGLADLPEFIYAATLPSPLTLEGGKTYWLSIVNNTAADTDDGWFWSTANNGGSHFGRTPPGSGNWAPASRDLAFELCGPVPDLLPECPEPLLYAQAPNLESGAASDRDAAGASLEAADNVMFTEDIGVYCVRWWGHYGPNSTVQSDADDFELRVYEDAGGAPAAAASMIIPLPQTVRAGTGYLIGGTLNQFGYQASLPAPLILKADTLYWFSIVNNTVADADDNWNWAGADVGMAGDAYRQLNPTGAWTSYGDANYAFEFYGFTSGGPCPTDFDGDGLTGGADLAVLLANWGPCAPPPPLLAPMEPARLDMLTNPADDASAVHGARR